MSSQEGYDLAYQYTVRLYPRYFTWMQFNINSENSRRQGVQIANRRIGPLGMGPECKVVVAILVTRCGRETWNRSRQRSIWTRESSVWKRRIAGWSAWVSKSRVFRVAIVYKNDSRRATLNRPNWLSDWKCQEGVVELIGIEPTTS